MIGIIQVGHQSMADRYAYLPFIGLFIMVCWGVAELVEGRESSDLNVRRPLVFVHAALPRLHFRARGVGLDLAPANRILGRQPDSCGRTQTR